MYLIYRIDNENPADYDEVTAYELQERLKNAVDLKKLNGLRKQEEEYEI